MNLDDNHVELDLLNENSALNNITESFKNLVKAISTRCQTLVEKI